MTVVGVDGCKAGWVAIVLSSHRISGHYLRHINEVEVVAPDAQLIAIDIPIGLPEAGRREADVAARRRLGRRRNSVFFAPVRSALEEMTHAKASAVSKQQIGTGISQQAFALGRKILEIERWLPSARRPVFEVHPELSFAVLLGQPAAASKKTWAGMVERWSALKSAGIDLAEVDPVVGSLAAVDDVLDGGVAAWSAQRLADGVAEAFPHDPRPDPDGRVVAIWA